MQKERERYEDRKTTKKDREGEKLETFKTFNMQFGMATGPPQFKWEEVIAHKVPEVPGNPDLQGRGDIWRTGERLSLFDGTLFPWSEAHGIWVRVITTVYWFFSIFCLQEDAWMDSCLEITTKKLITSHLQHTNAFVSFLWFTLLYHSIWNTDSWHKWQTAIKTLFFISSISDIQTVICLKKILLQYYTMIIFAL